MYKIIYIYIIIMLLVTSGLCSIDMYISISKSIYISILYYIIYIYIVISPRNPPRSHGPNMSQHIPLVNQGKLSEWGSTG